MADSKSKTDYGDTGRSESESEEQIRETEGGDTPVDDDEWGFSDKKPGLASETKAGIGIVVLLICTFCFLVYRKYDAQQQLIADTAGDTLGVVEGDETPSIEPADGTGTVFDDGVVVADNGPPPQSEPGGLDDELFSDTGDPANVSTNESPDFFDEPDGTQSGIAQDSIGDMADLDGSNTGFGEGFSDPPEDSNELFDSEPSASADVAANNMESDVFGKEPVGSFDAGFSNDDALFDDEPSSQSSVATAEPKPISDDFFDDEITAPSVANTAKAGSHDSEFFDDEPDKSPTTVGQSDKTFDDPPGGLLFDNEPAPKNPKPTIAESDRPSRDEMIAADRAAATSRFDSFKNDSMDSISTVRSKPVTRFDNSLFDDDPPSNDSERAPVARRVGQTPNDDPADRGLLFDDSVIVDAADRTGQPSIRDSVDDSIPIESTPTDSEFRNERMVHGESKFSDAPRGRILFSDDSSDIIVGSRATPDRTDNGFEDVIIDDRDSRTIRAEPAVLRREDISDVYVVQPGDNYWRISRNQYGTSRFYMALARLNRQRVADPRRLKPGMKLHTPSTESLIQRYPELFPDGIQTVSATRSEGPHGFFVARDGRPMYRTGQKDTLSAIAQNHLGRASRWKQIYQLNRSTLKNPNELTDGLVLVLPDDASHVRMVR